MNQALAVALAALLLPIPCARGLEPPRAAQFYSADCAERHGRQRWREVIRCVQEAKACLVRRLEARVAARPAGASLLQVGANLAWQNHNDPFRALANRSSGE